MWAKFEWRMFRVGEKYRRTGSNRTHYTCNFPVSRREHAGGKSSACESKCRSLLSVRKLFYLKRSVVELCERSTARSKRSQQKTSNHGSWFTNSRSLRWCCRGNKRLLPLIVFGQSPRILGIFRGSCKLVQQALWIHFPRHLRIPPFPST